MEATSNQTRKIWNSGAKLFIPAQGFNKVDNSTTAKSHDEVPDDGHVLHLPPLPLLCSLRLLRIDGRDIAEHLRRVLLLYLHLQESQRREVEAGLVLKVGRR